MGQDLRLGSILFPHTPQIINATMGPLMSKVNQALAISPIKGQVGFVMVGCIAYRSSFEPLSRPNHQTRFIYELATPTQPPGGWSLYIIPSGMASNLRLLITPSTFTAD